MTSPTVLAFDYGSKRIGVALVGHDGAGPMPLTTIDATADVWSQVRHLITKHQPNLLVVGWPRGLDGQTTQQTRAAEEFAEQLGLHTGKEVALQDEALSSEEAQSRLNPKLTIKQQRAQIDAVAAQVILEDYLREVH